MSATRGFKTLLVVNPRSAGGKTKRVWPELAKIAKKHLVDFEVIFTEGPGHATELARSGLRRGFEMIVSVGGDGTNNEVVNGFFDDTTGKPVKDGAVFGLIPRGTGCDFARGQGISRDPEEAFARLAGRDTAPLDVGRIDFTKPGGGTGVRHFVNIAGFGANGDVVNRTNRASKKLGGFVTFLQASLGSVMSYEPTPTAWSVDGAPEETATFYVVFVGNGRHCGGGMVACPGAKTDDGFFDITLIDYIGKAKAVLQGRHLYDGKVLTIPGARSVRARTITARPASPDAKVLVEADGEQPGILPATWTILPGALRLK